MRGFEDLKFLHYETQKKRKKWDLSLFVASMYVVFLSLPILAKVIRSAKEVSTNSFKFCISQF